MQTFIEICPNLHNTTHFSTMEGKPLIYIIDDDIVSQFATRYKVEQAGRPCKIVCCDSAPEGLNICRDAAADLRSVPDILLLDLVMPDMDGWEFLSEFEKIKCGPERTDIYVLSDFTDSRERKRAGGHPLVTDCFNKPLTKENMETIFGFWAQR